MNIIYVMIPISLMLAGGFLAAFIWSVRNGQINDLITPAHRILDEKDEAKK